MGSTDSVFQKIARRDIPATFLHEDDLCFAIRDIAPQAPFHALVIPRLPIVSLADALPEHQALLGHLLLVAKRIADAAGCGGVFRVVTNSGRAAGQSVFHLHLHVLGGGPLGALA
jgi:histidine triad (HIT) family protein